MTGSTQEITRTELRILEADLRLLEARMMRLSMSMEEKSWMILRGDRVENKMEKSTCSSRESRGRVKVTVSIPPPLAWNRDSKQCKQCTLMIQKVKKKIEIFQGCWASRYTQTLSYHIKTHRESFDLHTSSLRETTKKKRFAIANFVAM